MRILPDCDWLVAHPQGHHGYPQPENDDWEVLVYDDPCKRCGVHGPQRAGFRLRRSNRAPHSHFRQVNWVFDVWFVRPDIEALLRGAKFRGLDFREVIDHGSGEPFEGVRQLVVSTSIDGADTTKLPSVTCKPDNEEGPPLPGPKKYPPAAPYCGAVKHHPPTSLVVPAASLSRAPDVVYTAAWFGSGGSAFRHTLVSRRFAELVCENRWRGMDFTAVSHDGHSERLPTGRCS